MSLSWFRSPVAGITPLNALCAIPRSIICRIQFMCPRRVHSVGFFKSLLGKGLKTDSASMVKVTSMFRPPNS
eukprot:8946479-Pyramimonas_sp.AAC.1